MERKTVLSKPIILGKYILLVLIPLMLFSFSEQQESNFEKNLNYPEKPLSKFETPTPLTPTNESEKGENKYLSSEQANFAPSIQKKSKRNSTVLKEKRKKKSVDPVVGFLLYIILLALIGLFIYWGFVLSISALIWLYSFGTMGLFIVMGIFGYYIIKSIDSFSGFWWYAITAILILIPFLAFIIVGLILSGRALFTEDFSFKNLFAFIVSLLLLVIFMPFSRSGRRRRKKRK